MKLIFWLLATGLSVQALAFDPPRAAPACAAGWDDYLENPKTYCGERTEEPKSDPGVCHDPDSNSDAGVADSRDFATEGLEVIAPIPEEKMPVECFWTAMTSHRVRHSSGNINYVFCPTSGVREQKKFANCGGDGCNVPAPCVTANLVNRVRNSFIEVLDCVGLSYQELFPLIAQESGFQVNIRNKAGAIGIGQLLLKTVANMDRNHVFQSERYDELPKCKKFSKIFEESRVRQSPPTSCEMIALPDNPDKNFLYAAVFFKVARNEMLAVANLSKIRFANQNDKTQIVKDLTFYSYNGGDGCIAKMFHDYTKERAKVSAEQPPLTYAEFSGGFRSFLLKNFGLGGGGCQEYDQVSPEGLAVKQREVSAYANNIREAGRAINSEARKKCAADTLSK